MHSGFTADLTLPPVVNEPHLRKPDDHNDRDKANTIPASENLANHRSEILEDQPSKSKSRPEKISITDGDLIVAETIYDPRAEPPIQYVRRDASGALIRARAMKDGSGRVAVPPTSMRPILEGGVVRMPSDVGAYSSLPSLLEETRAFIHRYADCGYFLEMVLTHYVVMTWVYDRFDALPYLRLIGEPGTGKTRILLIAHQLCFRGILMGPGSTVSPFFRLMESFKGTVILDEADYRSSDLDAEMVKILNSGYQKGTPLVRSEGVGKTFVPTSFNVYGPKIIANRKQFEDRALETRCLTFQMTEKDLRDGIPKQLPSTFAEEGLALRNKLLAFRFAEFGRIVPPEGDLPGMDNRRAQIGASILAVICDPKFKREFIAYLGDSSNRAQREGLRSYAIEALIKVAETAGAAITLKEIAMTASNIALSVMGDEEIKPRAVGSIIRSLGFETVRHGSGMVIKRNDELLAKLKDRYEARTPELMESVDGVGSVAATG